MSSWGGCAYDPAQAYGLFCHPPPFGLSSYFLGVELLELRGRLLLPSAGCIKTSVWYTR